VIPTFFVRLDMLENGETDDVGQDPGLGGRQRATRSDDSDEGCSSEAAAAMTHPTESTQTAHALNSDGSGRSR
jgi:hypothetical protein